MAQTNVPTGDRPGNPTDPTMVQFEALVAEREAARKAYEAADTEETLLASRKATAAFQAYRPTNPAVMVAWLRLLIDEGAFYEGHVPILHDIADMLEARS